MQIMITKNFIVLERTNGDLETHCAKTLRSIDESTLANLIVNCQHKGEGCALWGDLWIEDLETEFKRRKGLI